MAKLTPFPDAQVFDDNGDPLNGGKVYTYEAGTSTPKASYTDASEDTANANPVILDSEGRGEIWLGEGSYKIRVFDSLDNLIDERDDIIGDSSSSFLGTTYSLSGNTTITSAYQNSMISVTAAATLSLLAVADAGEGFSFGVANDSSGVVTIDPNLSEQVNDATTVALQAGDSAIFVCTGAKWLMMGGLSVEDIKFTGNVTFTGKVSFANDGELTIASGAITVTGSNHIIDTESDASSDDLDTINGGTDGMELTLRIADDAREVVLKDGTGNIETPDGEDITLTDDENAVTLQYDDGLSKWLVKATFAADPADASTTTKGIVELSTSAETQTGTDTDRAVTPDGLHDAMIGGVAQSWSDVSGSRSSGVTYTNDTGAPIMVAITVGTSSSNNSYTFEIDGSIVITGVNLAANTSYAYPLSLIIPNGSTYELTVTTGTIDYWWELR